MENKENKKEDFTPAKKNIYEGVTISVKQLDKFIIGLVLVTIIIFLYLTSNATGLVVSFDTNGGSRVEDATYMYGEIINQPEEPVKEGYTFTGWYRDVNGLHTWDFENTEIESNMTLYAFWEEK